MTRSKGNVFVACEYSGTVRDAWIREGWTALSCDLLPSESDAGPHHQGDVFDVLDNPGRFFDGPIDLMIGHPPCTYLCFSGQRWLTAPDDHRPGKLKGEPRRKAAEEAAEFFLRLWNADVPRIALENPKPGYHDIQRRIGIPHQIVQPYEFGEPQMKGVGLWLRNLPPLLGTEDAYAAMMRLPYKERAVVHSASPGEDRGKIRSLFFPAIADAMAVQWGAVIAGEVAA